MDFWCGSTSDFLILIHGSLSQGISYPSDDYKVQKEGFYDVHVSLIDGGSGVLTCYVIK